MTTPSVTKLRAALAPYADPAGGWRCPVCGGPVRALDLGATVAIVGCHGTDLTRLLDEAHDAGYLDERRPA